MYKAQSHQLKIRETVDFFLKKYMYKCNKEPILVYREKLSKKHNFDKNFQDIKAMLQPIKSYRSILLVISFSTEKIEILETRLVLLMPPKTV